jgi:hypothetical protein
MHEAWSEAIPLLARIAAALDRIAAALEAANAADPVQAIAAALSDAPNERERGEPDLPPEEQWRLH